MSYLANIHIVCQHRKDARNLKAKIATLPNTWCHIYVIHEPDVREIERAYGNPEVMDAAWHSQPNYYALQVTTIRKTEKTVLDAVGLVIEECENSKEVIGLAVPYTFSMDLLTMEEIDKRLKQRGLSRNQVSLDGRRTIQDVQSKKKVQKLWINRQRKFAKNKY